MGATAPVTDMMQRPSQTIGQNDTPVAAARPLRLIQITDSHLFASPDGRLLGLDTRRSFTAVAELALGADERPAALVMTGDLVHDESVEGYRYLGQMFAAAGCPCFCIPGNHDRRNLMESYLGAATVAQVAAHRLGGWRLLFLDSTRPGDEAGRLTPDQIDQLERFLEADGAPTLIFLHHQPTPVHSAWIDTMDVRNGEQLLAVCDRHPHLKALVCGHIHQEFATTRGHYQILGTPSTCVQFLPGSPDFALDERPPGYRELRLYPDGRLDTRVIRLAAYLEPLVLDNRGY
jgi:3',5'-cyclic-AMP phosphodiesterase